MSKSPKVSVAIITYNHEKFIVQALESVLMQDVNFNYEIVASDDCSTDNTATILRFFQNQYPDKIRLFLNEKNLGMHENFVQTFFSCQGDYIALLEGDDYWTSPKKLQAQIDFLDHHPDYVLCFHNALIVFEDKRYPDSEYCPQDLPDDLTMERLLGFNYIPTASVVYRRGLIHKLPDWVFHLKMLDWPLHLLHAQCGKMRYLDQVMSVYRIHPKGVWSAHGDVWKLKEIIRMLEVIDRFFNFKHTTVVDESINRFYEMLLDSYKHESQNVAQFTSEKLASPHMKQNQEEQSNLMLNESPVLEVVDFNSQHSNLPSSRSCVAYGSQEAPISFPQGDYVSPGLQQIKPDCCFPEMLIGNLLDCSWPFLRREIPHNWYVDQRYPHVGFINRDEAHIIYNSALMFKGKRGLEVGCWMGWSACHVALAGVELDVIDPILEQPESFQSVRDSLKRASVLSSVRLIPGCSPGKVEELAKQEHRRWAFIFIDGDHESPHPLNDAKACEPFAEDDALILFHDLVSPGVAEGLEYLRRKGWNVMIYHTMQVMGVAWRGNVEPVFHQPDPNVYWQIPSHLKSFCGNLGQQLPEANHQLETTLDGLQGALDWLRLQLKSSQEAHWQVRGEKEWFEAEWRKSCERIHQVETELSQSQDDLSTAQTQIEQANAQIEQTNTQFETQITQTNAQIEQAHRQQSILESKLQQSRGLISYLQKQLFQVEDTQQRLTSSEQAVQSLQAMLHQAQMQIENLKINAEKKRERLQLKKRNLEQKKFELIEAQERIAAMETSKFWKMRKTWFNVKRLLGLKGQE